MGSGGGGGGGAVGDVWLLYTRIYRVLIADAVNINMYWVLTADAVQMTIAAMAYLGA